MIAPDHQKYLGFAWPFNGVLRYFTFAVLPFGLSSACFCFPKLLRPLVKRWRSMGHNSFVYFDDDFGSQPERTSAVAAGFIQRKDLDSSGLLVNDAAFGGFSASLYGTVTSGMFTADDLGHSSTFRELKAIYYVFLLLSTSSTRGLRTFTDNQSAARIVSVGSSKIHLQSVALSIFGFCFFTWYCLGSAVDSNVTQREG